LELNGLYKMAMAKVNRAYMSHKPSDKKRFVQTDIIPLVNQAWAMSFGQADIARKQLPIGDGVC
jgi:hypothetical protein